MTTLKGIARAILGSPIIPIVILGALVFGAIFAPWVAPYSPVAIDLMHPLSPPFYQDGGSLQHLFGTDKVGRDIFSRVLYGGRISLLLAVIVLVIGGGIGTILGLISGYAGGKWDAVIQRGVEAILSLPTIMVALVFGLHALPQVRSAPLAAAGPFALAAAALGLLLRVEAREEAPLLDLGFFARRGFVMGVAIGALAMFSIMGLLLYYNLFAQSPAGLGLTALAAGASLLPLSVTQLALALSAAARSSGVPAWAYQRRNWSRSRPEASAIAATKSSQVTAWPSWRSK